MHSLSQFFLKDTGKRIIRFLLLFCCIIVIPCTIITHSANNLITQKIYANNENYLNYASVTLDGVFQACKIQSELLLENNYTDFYTLLNAEDSNSPEVTTASYRFNKTLNAGSFNTNFFSDIFIYFKNPDMIFTTSDTYNSSTYFEKYRIFKDYPDDFFKTMMNQSYKSMFCPPTDVMTINNMAAASLYSRCIPMAMNLTGPAPSDAMLVLLLDETKLDTVFDQMNTVKSSYLYLLDTKTNQILNHPSDTAYDSLLSLSGQKYNTPTGIRTMTTADGDDYRILWKKSSVNHLLYICVEPDLLITQQLNSNLYLTLFIVFILLILCAFLYYLYTTKLRQALKSVFHHMKQVSDNPAALSNDDSESVDISTIMKAAETLHRQKKNNRPQLVRAFLSRLFNGLMDDEEIISFCEHFHIFQEEQSFAVFVMQTNFYLLEESCSAETTATFLLNMEMLLSQYGYTISMNNPSSFVVILSSSDTETLTAQLSELTNLLEIKNSGKFPERKCGQSAVFHDIREAYTQYCAVLTLLENHKVSEEKLLYVKDDLAENISRPLLSEEKQKIRALAEHSPAECPIYVQTLLADFREQNIAFSQYQSIITGLLFLLQEILYENNISFSTLFFIEETELFALSKQILLREHLDEVCLHLYNSLAEQQMKKAEAADPVDQAILAYIEEHLSDISLTMLADAIGMNQNYLSQYFKKHFGVSFIDYITKKKIDKAKDMLIHTNLTCKAIGEKLGYNDANVFTRAFKKSESVTPNEYRKSH